MDFSPRMPKGCRGSVVELPATDTKSEERCLSEAEQTEQARLTEVRSKMRTLFESGAPLFDKEAIRWLGRQLRNLDGRKGPVYILGFDGSIVEFESAPGRRISDEEGTLTSGIWSRQGDVEVVLDAPHILYIPHKDVPLPVSSADCCNLRTGHHKIIRDILTKEIITPPLQAFEEAIQFFREVLDEWEDSAAYEQLHHILAHSRPICTQIVAFGLGNISREIGEIWHQGPALQHAMLLRLWAMLAPYSSRSMVDFRVYAQDPAYSAIDKRILEHYGITVVDDPEGFIQVNESTAVVAANPNIAVRQIVSDLAQPKLMIWNKIRNDSPYRIGSDPESPRLQKMIRDLYDVFEFPGERRYFGDLAIYVRRDQT